MSNGVCGAPDLRIRPTWDRPNPGRLTLWPELTSLSRAMPSNPDPPDPTCGQQRGPGHDRMQGPRSGGGAAHPLAAEASPSRPSRARLTAAANNEKSAATFTNPRTRARRPPCRRRIRCPILRSTFGRVAR
jgi:hypothetical protein